MIKIVFCFALIFVCTPYSNQQNRPNTSQCTENYTLESETVPSVTQSTNDIIISWDFSKTNNKEHLEMTLRAQPLNSCWKGLEGTDRSEIKIFKISDISRNNTGNLTITYRDINAKCFKWQAVITDTEANCSTETKWQFLNLL